MKVIGYIRVSTDEQNFDSQAKQIENYCKLHNFELVTIVKEKGISGSINLKDRPAGKKIQMLINDGAKGIIAAKLDRMFRSTVDAITQTDNWNKQEVAVHIIDFCGQALNTASALGRMVFTMQAAFAEMELHQIRDRTKTALQHKKSKGEAAGQTPFGYTRNGDLITEHPRRAEAIKLIRTLREEGRSLRFIADCVTEETGIKCSHVTVQSLITTEDIYEPTKALRKTSRAGGLPNLERPV